MPDKDLTINMRLRKDQAEAAARQFHAAELARVARLDDAHDRAAKSGVAGIAKQKVAADGLGSSFDKAGLQLGKMMAGYATLGVAMSGARMLAEAWAAVEQNVVKTGEAALAFEKQTRSLAALQNIDKPSDVVASALDFAVKTAMPLEKAQAFQEAFLGSSPAGIEKGNVDEATLSQFKVESGIMAERQGADVKVRGELAGILGQFKGYNVGDKPGQFATQDKAVLEMLGDLEKIRVALTAGRGEDAPLTSSLLHVAGQFVGEKLQVKDLASLAAQVSTASTVAGAMPADVRTEQLGRGLGGSTPKQMRFLESWAGIGEHDDMEQRIDKAVTALRKTVASGRDARTFLVEGGMNAEQTRAMVEMEGLYEVYKSRLADARKAGVGADVRKANEEFLKSPGGRSDVAKVKGAAADVLAGQKNMDWLAVQQMAEAEWKAELRDESLASWVNNAVMGMTRLSGPTEGRRRRIGIMGINKMREQARAAGIRMTDEEEGGTLEEKGRNLSAALRAKGVVPGANMTGVEDGINRLVAHEDKKARERDNKPGPPLDGKPNPKAAVAR